MPNYSQLTIFGYRGFSTKETLNLAIPNGKPGSGLTIIVGPNNSGKSTIFEAFRAIAQREPPSFTEGKRNKTADRVEISIKNDSEQSLELKSVVSGSSESEFISKGLSEHEVGFVTLASRRTFSPYFGKSIWARNAYIASSPLAAVRGGALDAFSYRLFNIQKNQEEYNKQLNKIIDNVPSWVIDQNDQGSYYLKFTTNGTIHNSDGAGEGLLSIFTIVDALYDSKPGELIVIDEPELSLHPALQRKLFDFFIEYSIDRQLVIFTHSPFLINWNVLINGGKISRTVKEGASIKIYSLKESTISETSKLLENYNNPHILGLQANEVFFLEDKIILVEGQEDVVFMKLILEKLSLKLKGTFFGWGIGGADNCLKILNILQDLGFKKVVVILDNNMCHVCDKLRTIFSQYSFYNIPADDIRDKPPRAAKEAISGIISSNGKEVKECYSPCISEMVTKINDYLN